MTNHDWILQVLADIESYAKTNHLVHLERQMQFLPFALRKDTVSPGNDLELSSNLIEKRSALRLVH